MERVEGIQRGDVVEIDRGGRRFHALVLGPGPGAGYAIQPLDRRVDSHLCRPREIVGHWERRGRPRRERDPLHPSPRQLELELGRT